MLVLVQVLSKVSDKVRDVCLPDGALTAFPHNCFTTMTISGAKGSKVNHQQITCQLGQQELEGARVPIMVSGKTLPVSDLPCNIRREGGKSLVIGGSSLVILEGKTCNPL